MLGDQVVAVGLVHLAGFRNTHLVEFVRRVHQDFTEGRPTVNVGDSVPWSGALDRIERSQPVN